MTDTDKAALTEAYKIAATSLDPSTQNGVLLMGQGETIIVASNRFPLGVAETPERLADRNVKLAHIEHAERNAIFWAARKGVMTDKGIMYACWAACTECARAIIQAGIWCLVVHKHPAQDSRPEWSASIAAADTMLAEAGVVVRRVEGKIGATIRFGGKMIEV